MMGTYTKIDEVTASPQYGNTGTDGWGFHLRTNLLDDEAPHRQVLERFAEAYPQASIILPPYDWYEDYVECYARWNTASVWIYYETILSYLRLWSEDREAVVAMRTALLPFAA